MDCDDVYCCGLEDLSQEEARLTGICITGLPDGATGTALLGTRPLHFVKSYGFGIVFVGFMLYNKG